MRYHVWSARRHLHTWSSSAAGGHIGAGADFARGARRRATQAASRKAKPPQRELPTKNIHIFTKFTQVAINHNKKKHPLFKEWPHVCCSFRTRRKIHILKDIMVKYVKQYVKPRTSVVRNVETPTFAFSTWRNKGTASLWDRKGDDRDAELRYNNKLGDNIFLRCQRQRLAIRRRSPCGDP